ncbi:MAG: hypothetical protein AAF367_11175 [Pseudomonadota bacterium]
MPAPCLEMVRFKLNAGADSDAFRAAAPIVTDWAARQPGFQYRSLAEQGDGWWVDLVWWRSEAEALAAADKVMGALGATSFMMMIDPMSVEMGHHPVVHMSGPPAEAA